jgi:hypothetical protein
MIERVISGGQTGVDQAALRAARACGIATGGWAPLGWLTEGPLDEEGHPFPKTVASPWLAEWGLVECDEPGFRARTVANVLWPRRGRSGSATSCRRAAGRRWTPAA